jgi:hypothetical protein
MTQQGVGPRHGRAIGPPSVPVEPVLGLKGGGKRREEHERDGQTH